MIFRFKFQMALVAKNKYYANWNNGDEDGLAFSRLEPGNGRLITSVFELMIDFGQINVNKYYIKG